MAGFLRTEAFNRAAVQLPFELVTFTRVRSADSTYTFNNNLTANWGATPAAGDLLVAMICHGSSLAANPVFDGSNWVRRSSQFVGLENEYDSRHMSVWTKIAGPSEPQYVTAAWAANVPTRLVLQQFHPSVADYGAVFLDAKTDDSGTGATGNVDMNGAADPPLNIPNSKMINLGSKPQSVFRCTLVSGPEWSNRFNGPNGVTYANVGSGLEWDNGSSGQLAMNSGFGWTHEAFEGGSLSETVNWTDPTYRTCGVHLLMGGVTATAND